MAEDIKAFTGLGFSIYEIYPEDRAEYPCSMHKLDEEREAHRCPEEPFAFMAFDIADEGICMCKRHFALFASDMLSAIEIFGDKTGGVADPSETMKREDTILTYPAMIELIMDTKDQLHGNA